LDFGRQKFNLQRVGRELEPKALKPTADSADFCLNAATPLEDAMAALGEAGVAIEEAPVDRAGAEGPIRSLHIRDPDHNLIEISNYRSQARPAGAFTPLAGRNGSRRAKT
jgi:catechol 2,3-dioxygenase-like lactoylglutathione lyase family enzyme